MWLGQDSVVDRPRDAATKAGSWGFLAETLRCDVLNMPDFGQLCGHALQLGDRYELHSPSSGGEAVALSL